MRRHEHYLGWTIEIEDGIRVMSEYWICTQYVDIDDESIKIARYAIDAISIETCRSIIREIISDQINSTRKVIGGYHSELVAEILNPTYDISEDED